MTTSPFIQMQHAVDIVNTSPHPKNKIAATLFGKDQSSESYSISYTNYWPDSILQALGAHERIGNSSGTVHAETACILHAPYSYNASLCVTDPFCPNCAKNIAEAGIKNVYIDHKGMNKDFIERRVDAFKNMSMRICEKAGINVYLLFRKEQKIETIYQSPENFLPHEDRPIDISPITDITENSFLDFIQKGKEHYNNSRLAIAAARDNKNNIYTTIVRSHAATGYDYFEDQSEIKNPPGKYSFIQEPLNRLLTSAPKHGLKLDTHFVYYSVIPTSRELVNLLATGASRIFIGDTNSCRDEYGFKALEQLKHAKILDVIEAS